MHDRGLRYHAVRDSLAAQQALTIDNPCSLSSISAACRFANGSTVFWIAVPYRRVLKCQLGVHAFLHADSVAFFSTVGSLEAM
jgi:hypothetical protein